MLQMTNYTPVCLVIVFNHRYDSNIQKLRQIYQERFHKIVFLVPFYEGTDSNVIAVYESSYQFPGFLIQAYHELVQIGSEYYFFIEDDVILSPYIDENNVLDILKMKNKLVFITNIRQLNSKGSFDWSHSRFSSNPFRKTQQTQWRESIPDYQTALKIFENFFKKKYKEKYTDEFFETDTSIKSTLIEDSEAKDKQIKEFIQRNGGNLQIPYPMARGYSDVFMIRKEVLFPIARLCGVFSAMNMFAEISLPTAIVLSVDKKNTVCLNETGLCHIAEWGDERGIMEEKYHCDFRLLYKDWRKDILFVHPIKLSKWKL